MIQELKCQFSMKQYLQQSFYLTPTEKSISPQQLKPVSKRLHLIASLKTFMTNI